MINDQKNINKDSNSLPPERNTFFKISISVLAGLLSFFLSKYSFSILVEEALINIPWSLVFTVVIALAYGVRFGLIAAFFGGAIYPFYLWESNGWANVMNVGCLIVLFVLLGIYSEYKLTRNRRVPLLVLTLIFSIFYSFFLYICYVYLFNIFLSINPPFWIKETVGFFPQSLLKSFFVKDIFNFSLIIFFSEALVNTTEIRRFLGLPVQRWMKNNSKAFIGSMSVSILIWLVIYFLNRFILSNDSNFNALSFMVLFWSGGILGRVFIWFQETSLKSKNEIISERNKAERSETNFRLLVSNTFDGILINDQIGRYLYANAMAANITGYSVEELVELETKDLTPKRNLDKVKDRIKNQFDSNESLGNFESSLVHKSGNEILIEIAASKTTWQGVPSQIISFRDVSKRKIVEQELIDAKLKAEESDRLKSAFLTNMSHEIRTPMNGIMGFTSLLKNHELSASKQQDYIDIIQKSGNRMLNTVNDIIEVSRIETEQINVQLKEVNITNKIENLIRFFEPEAAKKGIILKAELPNSDEIRLLTDESKINSILTNLIKNAIKFTHKGSVVLNCKIEEEVIEFCIKDTGIGIPKERQEAIFNRFEQADIADVDALEGSGLGLSITKSYVQMLDGNIGLESEQGAGSSFWFTLPFIRAAETSPDSEPVNVLDNKEIKKNLTILIAEDDEFSYLHMSILLKEFDAEIIRTKTGVETLKVFNEYPKINLILMDIKMPEMDGLSVTKKIREVNNEIIIIAQTAYAMDGDKLKAINAGCNDFISKPIQKNKLFELLKMYV